MTAHPVVCLVDYEDGYRTVITLEEPSDADTEMGAIARLRIMTDDGKTLQVGLSPEAAEALERRLRELRGAPESVATSLETGAELHRSVGRRQMMTTSDPTTTDAVAMLQWMHACVVHSENHGDVPRIGSDEVLAVLRATQAERARHAEEVAMLRDVHRGETREGGE